LVDFGRIRDPLEKPILIDLVLEGAEKSGCANNIFFINYEKAYHE
jgi:hypothetical protein